MMGFNGNIKTHNLLITPKEDQGKRFRKHICKTESFDEQFATWIRIRFQLIKHVNSKIRGFAWVRDTQYTPIRI